MTRKSWREKWRGETKKGEGAEGKTKKRGMERWRRGIQEMRGDVGDKEKRSERWRRKRQRKEGVRGGGRKNRGSEE